MPLLWPRWRMCLRYTVAHMTKTIPLFAWMKSRSSFLPTFAKDSAPKRTAFNMRTTSISATEQQAFSFLQSLWPDGDMPMLKREGLLRIGQKNIGSPPHSINDLLQLVDLLIGEFFSCPECSEERRQRASKGLLHILLAMSGVVFLP